MFIPIGDDNPTDRRPIVNYVLIALNIAVFLVTALVRDDQGLIRYMVVPADLRWHTLFTSMFMHAGLLHLAGNMVFLWIFGDNVEDRLGHIGYLVFYLACGLAADLAHILSVPHSVVPTLGASGAISGVMGAYILFFPRHEIKTFVWFGLWYSGVIRTPAFVWIGIWIAEQFLLNALTHSGGGGVAYVAHIGGFAAGVAIAFLIRLVVDQWRAAHRRGPPLESKTSERRLFTPIPDDPGIEFMDEPGDGYSVLRLNGEPTDVGRIGEIVAAVTSEASTAVASRLDKTRGMIARAIPREAAGRIQRELHTLGIPSAIILHNRSNFPPKPVPVEGASWDDRALRLRAGEQILMVPWSAPFLFAGARVEERPFIDVFVNRRTSYRILGARHVPLTEVDPISRKEVSTDLSGFARAILERGGSGTSNDGVRAAAGLLDWGQLDFKSPTDYDDYIFWLYNLILAQRPQS